MRAHIGVGGAGIVDPLLVTAKSAEHLVDRLSADLAEDVPEGDVERGLLSIAARFDPARYTLTAPRDDAS